MIAEDVELDFYATYQMFKHLGLGIEFDYLFADDAMDYYESENDGRADEDLHVVNSTTRYSF